MYTNIPKMDKIELKSWYKEFEWYYPNCEMETKNWFVENTQSDWNFLDIGANIGYYSILFSKLAPMGHTWAIEPTKTESMLKINLSFNKIDNVSVHKIAFGSKIGRFEERIYSIWGNDPEVCFYDFTTVDNFVSSQKISRLDCIKIDVDSFDFEVLQGAYKIMEAFNPIIVVELNHALGKRNQANTQALKWMVEKGYKETLCLDSENFIFQKKRHFRGNNYIKVYF